DPFLFEIVERAEDRKRRGNDDDDMHENAERIRADQIVVGRAAQVVRHVNPHERKQRADEREPAERTLARGGHERVHDHDDDAEKAEDHLRGQPVEIEELTGGRHHCCPRLSIAASATLLPAACGLSACAPMHGIKAGRDAFCGRFTRSMTLLTEASIRRVKSGDARPMKMITAAMVTRMIRSRVEASGSVLFFSTVTSPSATRW